MKGPSSESFGMGTTGGAINLQQKTAHLKDTGSVDVSVGTGPMVRTTVDINKQVNETTAARAVGMYHDQDIVDRDHVFSDRWGFLGSLAFGLGTDTKFTLNYLHQENDRRPDYGVPFAYKPGATVGLPVTEFGVPRSNFYGKNTDKDESTVDMLTARLTARVNPNLTFNNDTRLEFFNRDFSTTTALCAQLTCSVPFSLGLDPAYSFGAGGGSQYTQDSWGIQNISTAIAKFNTGHLRHEFVAGIDVYYQEDARLGKSYLPAKGPVGTIWNPDFNSDTYSIADNPNNRKKADATDFALFASDRVWLSPQFSILAGIRWDDYKANYAYTNTATGVWNPEKSSETRFFSPKVSLIWEPTKQQLYYASWATSATPAGQYIINSANPIGTGAGQESLDPEENETYEIGAKYSLLGGKLGLTGALFRVDKSNAFYTDPLGNAVASGEKQRVQGVELGMTGKLTDKWTVNIAYAYLDSEITFANTAAIIGNHVPGVPENSGNIWTTYDVASLVNVPGQLIVGAGLTYAQDMYIRNDQTTKVPVTLSFDSVISYEKDGWKFAVNGYNLTDELYYDAFFQGENSYSSRAIPAPGRTVIFSVGKKF
ncbi:MAG: TonB-dependent receptor [Hyphomicrobiaceae bacterium]